MRATVTALVGAALLIGGSTACSGGTDSAASAPTSQPSSIKPVAEAVLTAPTTSGDQPKGLTYDAKRAPADAKVTAGSSVENGQTTIELKVVGLLPNTKYGSHVHTKPCGAKPADSGPHYQNEKDPVPPSVDHKYANADNEIWLDFTTDAAGAASAMAKVKWQFRKGEANAVVIHASHTSTEHGKAGTAGDRLACLTAQF